MHFPQLATLTPEQARALVEDRTDAIERWCRSVNLALGDHKTYTALFRALGELAEQAYLNDEQRKADARHSQANSRRRDRDQVIHFMDRAAKRLSPRLEEVYHLCFERGLSLAAAAATLGISRNSVRTHLRRLRKLVHKPHRPHPWLDVDLPT